MSKGVGALRIALVGTRGVPARYGGFETCVEEVGKRLAARGHEVTVYCRTQPTDISRPDQHLGMHLVHLPAVRNRSLETLSHTGLSVAHLVRHGADAAVVFNSANSPFLPMLRAARIPVATHVDGLEWRRAKWGTAGRRYYRFAESAAVRWSDALIADAQGIASYYDSAFGVPTSLITYGAPLQRAPKDDALAPLDLKPDGYHLVVARFEPENHVDLIVEGFTRSSAAFPLVVVGTAPYADEYTARVKSLADDRVRFFGGVWDQDLLDQLYANARTYLHGHSVGGTNPSLLRAIGAGTAVAAFDVSFNREVLGADGEYFRTPAEVAAAVDASEHDPDGAHERAARLHVRAERYDWDDVADRYEELCRDLSVGRTPGPHPVRRRPDSDHWDQADVLVEGAGARR